MIEKYRHQITSLLKGSGEAVDEDDEFFFTRLGEGMGYTSLLWSVRFGEKRYAVKITDIESRIEEAKRIYGDDQEKIDSHARLFAQQHNRELFAYRYLESIRHRQNGNLGKIACFFGGIDCTEDTAGIIIMENLSATSVDPEPSQAGLSLETILSTIDGIVGYQSAYLSSEQEIVLLPKDILFVLGSAGVIKCIESVHAKGYLTEHWKSALLSWSTPEALREMQYGREEGEPQLVLGHTDMWTNNLLFERKEKSETLQLLAVVDWQCATVGLCLLDIASVVGINMSPSQRRANEEKILRHYVERVEEKRKDFVREFDVDFDSIHRLYLRCLRFAALQLCLTVGGMLTKPVGDSEEIKEKRRKHAEQLSHSAERLKGILEDIVIL